MSKFKDEFEAALLASGAHPEMRPDNQIFGPFIGSWDLKVVWFDELGRQIRHEAGEWHFAWVLEGRAIQDVWIVPPRPIRSEAAEPYEYGTSVRFFDPAINAWRSTWIGPMHGMIRTFMARKVDDQVVLETTAGSEPRLKWSFSNIDTHSFDWRNEVWEGSSWRLQQSFHCQRR